MWIIPLSSSCTCQPGGEAGPSGWEQLAGSYPEGKSNILLLLSPKVQITDEVLFFIWFIFFPLSSWIPTSIGPILNKCELGQSIAILCFDATTASSSPRLLCGDLGVICVPNTSTGKGRTFLCLQGEKRKIVWVQGLEDGKKEHSLLKKMGKSRINQSFLLSHYSEFGSEAVLLNSFLCNLAQFHVTGISYSHQTCLHSGWAT